MNYHNKAFKALSNTDNGETSSDTIFYYKQEGTILSAVYAGGEIKQGHLLGLVSDNGEIDMHYHHLNNKNEFKTGICHSKPELMPNGKIRLHEIWQWTSGDKSKGSFILEEI